MNIFVFFKFANILPMFADMFANKSNTMFF